MGLENEPVRRHRHPVQDPIWGQERRFWVSRGILGHSHGRDTDTGGQVMPTGTQTQQTARAGEYYVAAELNRRGLHAVTFTGNMPNIDVMAHHPDRPQHPIYIQVKTKGQALGRREWGKATRNPIPIPSGYLLTFPMSVSRDTT